MKTVLLIAWLLIFCCRQILAWLNLRHQQRYAGNIGPAFRRFFERETIARALAYATDKQRLALIETGVVTALFTVFMFSACLPRYDRWTGALSDSLPLRGLVFFLTLIIARQLLDLPFSWYRNFRIETRFGFNTMSLRLWMADTLKSLLLSLLLGGALIAGALWLVARSPSFWWLWVWGFFCGFSLLMMIASPYLIEPLFFKFTPIEKPGLEARIRHLAQQAGLHAERVFQVDASRRSRHGNAYFTGLGRQKRIVLFDTLLDQMEDGEILAVLAHEIGHWKHRHIRRRLIGASLLNLGGLLLAWLLLTRGLLPKLLELDSASIPAQFLILTLPAAMVRFILEPFGNLLSRRHERQADRFACALTKRPQDLATALIKLARDNLAALNPHPLYAWFHYGHPPLQERVDTLMDQTPAAS